MVTQIQIEIACKKHGITKEQFDAVLGEFYHEPSLKQIEDTIEITDCFGQGYSIMMPACDMNDFVGCGG